MKLKLLTALIIFLSLDLCGQSGMADLELRISGFHNEKGMVRINIFTGPEGFPDQSEKSFAADSDKIKPGEMVFYFRGLPGGIYAVSVLHDENENGIMEKSFIGKPKEGFAFSNNFKPVFSLPSFGDASFNLSIGKNVMNLKIIYF